MAVVRANPIPVLLIGAGLGYLVFDSVCRAAEWRRLAKFNAGQGVPVREPNFAENDADRLNEGLEESFHGSEPISVRIPNFGPHHKVGS